MRPRTSMTALALVLLCTVAVACSSGNNKHAETVPTSVAATPYPLDNTLRLDQVQVLGSHNSYHGRPYPQVLALLRKGNPATAASLDYAHKPLPQQFDLGIRQIELDVWDDPAGGKYAHPAVPLRAGVKLPDEPSMLKPGYKVLHQANVDTNSTCLTFVACMQLVKTWSDAHPGHVPIDIHVEMEDPTVTEPMWQRLENEIRSVFPRSDVITPDDVRGSFPTLGEAVRTHGWPTLGKVRGKVYFTLDNEGLRSSYLAGHPSLRGRLLFTPSKPGEDDAAFAKLNDPVGDRAAIAAALAAHMIVRTRADADTAQARKNDTTDRDAAFSEGAQLVSTDYELPDPTVGTNYTVRVPGGTPARCDPVTAPPGCKPTDVENPAFLKRR